MTQFPELFPFRKMLQQPSGFFPGLGRIGCGVPTVDEGIRQLFRQLRQFRHGEPPQPAAVVVAEAVGTAGEQHPVAALQPLRQGVGKA
ncbi:MAG: hypothetical protein ACREVJ_06200, partial [Gammaproteobacteria bacterium]